MEDEGWHIEVYAKMGEEMEQMELCFGESGFAASGGYDLTLDSGLTTGVLRGRHDQLWEEYCG